MLPTLEVRGLGKRFEDERAGGSLKESCARLLRRRERRAAKPEDWVFRGVSFTALPGETIALTGTNGAGKSTLIRVLAGVMGASEGTVARRGASGLVLGAATSVNAELSGRDNIRFLCRLQRGVASSPELEDEVAAFAGIASADLGKAVKYYSSGMAARLGLGVALMADFELLFLDEALAHADRGFRGKCQERLLGVAKKGGTVILASHDEEQVSAVCGRRLAVSGGMVVEEGGSGG